MNDRIKKVEFKRGRAVANSVVQGKSVEKQDFGFEDNRSATALQLKINEDSLNKENKLVQLIQFCKDNVGLVPPTTYGRSAKFKTPDKPQKSRGRLHAIGAKDLTRSERMINRIGRLIVQEANVHVAVALDGNALVISANKESPDLDKKIDKIAAKLKDLLTEQDPLGEDAKTIKHPKIEDSRRTKDIDKVSRLLKGDYTGDEGIELNDEVKGELVKIKAAIERGVISEEQYKNGEVGIYAIVTTDNPSERQYNMHGELKVTGAIKERRKAHPDSNHKDVFVGGTWLDCFSCNASHKIMNKTLEDDRQNWKFYTGGTHGGMFVGYRPQQEVVSNPAKFKELTGADVSSDSFMPKVDDSIAPENGQLPYDSESEDEDYDILDYDRKLYREKKAGRSTLRSATNSTKDKIAEQTKLLDEQNQKVRSITKNLERAQKQLGELWDSLKNAEKQIAELVKEKQSIESRLKELEGDKSGEIIARMKGEVDSKLHESWKDRNAKWDSGKWIPENVWKPLGRSQQILDGFSSSTRLRLESLAKQNHEEVEKGKHRLSNVIPELMKEWEESSINIKQKIEALDEEIKKIEESKSIEEKTKSEIEKATQIEITRLKGDFSTTHKISYEEAIGSEENRKIRREKMDHFQFVE